MAFIVFAQRIGLSLEEIGTDRERLDTWTKAAADQANEVVKSLGINRPDMVKNQGYCSPPLDGLYSDYVNPQWVKLLNILQMNVTYERCVGSELFTADGRRILDFMNSDSSVGWNVVVPPGVPADRVAVLRDAFDATMRDPELLAEAQKRGLEIVPGRGDEVQEVVARTIATPPDALTKLQAIISAPK